jgi:hypothetical protein
MPARPGRFELPTPGSVDQCSIQLSYGRLPLAGTGRYSPAPCCQCRVRTHSQTFQSWGQTVTRAPLHRSRAPRVQFQKPNKFVRSRGGSALASPRGTGSALWVTRVVAVGCGAERPVSSTPLPFLVLDDGAVDLCWRLACPSALGFASLSEILPRLSEILPRWPFARPSQTRL